MSLPFPLLAVSAGSAALVTFLLYMVGVFVLAALSNRLMQSKSFLSEYFLGSRGLGVWAFALTFAATAASGGSFTGFPSKIYTHGWILALWIGSYMVVPLCGLGFMGKRINQVARISGAITVPDVIRDRFRSPAFAGLTVALIVFFISVNLIAQFKSGALILKTLLADVPQFTEPAAWFGQVTANWSFLAGVDPQYTLCLLTFGIAVVVYTTYGGFHAVVWTDVMQGVVMVCGVLLMVPLTLWAVGGLPNATAVVAQQTPPQRGTATLKLDPLTTDFEIAKGDWVHALRVDEDELNRTGRLKVVELEVYRILDSVFVAAGTPKTPPAEAGVELDPNSPDMLPGWWAKDVPVLKITSPDDKVRAFDGHLEQTDDGLFLAGFPERSPSGGEFVASAAVVSFVAAHDPVKPGSYVTGPGYKAGSDIGFLPLSLAISFFFMWAISGSGQPHYWVRLMAFKDAKTLRRSILMVACYYTLIYLPLVIIFVCARVLLPGMEAESDRIMPAMAVFLTQNAGVAWLAGLLVAAPFAAVMSTVDSVLLVISSALVRDVYQRNVNPDASEKRIKWMTYVVTLAVGFGAMLGALNPPRFLQDIIVYTGSGLASCFLAPMIYGLYWPRVNKAGAMAGMLAGFAAHLSMYVAGIWVNDSFFEAYKPYDLDPVLVGLFTSFVTVPVVSLLTPAPPVDLVRRYFCRKVEQGV